MGKNHRHGILSRIGKLSRQHFINGASQRIDIGTLVGNPSSSLLRGNVVNGTHYRHIGGFLTGSPGNSKIRNFNHTFGADNHILRLNISVNNSHLMGSIHTFHKLQCNADGFSLGAFSLSVDIVFQGNSFHQFHNDKMGIPLIHYIIGGNNV